MGRQRGCGREGYTAGAGLWYTSGALRLPTLPTWLWIALATLLIVALNTTTIALCGPWDPWETHYGEVARNIIARDDPMDLWWRPGYGPDGKREGVFASKHALPFWAMALSFKVFGVGNGQAANEMVRGYLPELALRLPSMIMGLGSAALLAWVVARLVHWRAGLLAALVLVTMPQYAILTRQAVTDMFFVGPVCLAMAAWAMAWFERERELRTKGRGLLEIPWDKAWLGFFVLLLISAVAPLAVLHRHVTSPTTIETVTRWGRTDNATVDDLHTIARHLIMYWVLIVLIVVRSLRWRRRSQVWMGVLYIAGGLALMGKGMIGPGIIGLLVLVHMLVTGRLHLLWERRCELGVGIVIFVVTCFPWHHAMAIFRGERWVNELIVVNNLARFTTGEQQQAVGGFMFYLRTLGLAALPWSAVVVPAIWGAVAAFRKRAPEPEATDEGAAHLALEPRHAHAARTSRSAWRAASPRPALGDRQLRADHLQRDQVLPLPGPGPAAAGDPDRRLAGLASRRGRVRPRGWPRGSGSGCWGWCCAT